MVERGAAELEHWLAVKSVQCRETGMINVVRNKQGTVHSYTASKNNGTWCGKISRNIAKI